MDLGALEKCVVATPWPPEVPHQRSLETPEQRATWVATVGFLDPKFCLKNLPKKCVKF